ncbi:fatty acid desaturase [Novosphingobium nitrogenifigens DSM 19370]|uniref:Fatty acid desaturase n=1 Tax=Novosphingobium nitrogenifigens DSM 19370 TaxID=983920 RepID=F1Z8E9_9SPHN|nr:fatty acid desaturase [Novosphingobium nitrogenifigens]EGD59076.1 fatty acid desaturase [Novosphingobium nitrogenifigens DSM 19370]
MAQGQAGNPGSISVEWPTLVLAVAIYGGWLALAYAHAALPWPVLMIAGAWLIAWHGSLQHEVIHGHPTPYRWINDAIGFPPLSLWLPYAIYRRDHIAHHRTPHLTDPLDDSESNYLARPGGPAHLVAAAESTLAGRMVLGPPIRIVRFWWSELRRAGTHPLAFVRDWAPHMIGVTLVLGWLHHVGLSPMTYVLCFIWPGTALSLIRSYAEHRASADPAARTAIVADNGPLALLFLNNNLHIWHHAYPALPWYALPAAYRADPDAFPQAPRYAHYGVIFARFLLRPHDRLVHPAPLPGKR